MMSDEQRVTWLASFSHFITHGYMTLLPAVLVVIATEHGMSFTDIGLIALIGYFLYGLGSFPAGYLADRFGSKRLLTVGVFGMALSSLLVGLSSNMPAFAVAYGMLGLFASIHHPAGLSLIARRVHAGKGRALGVHGVLGNVGLFFTPLAAGFCVMFFNTWRAAYILYSVVGLVFAIVLHRVRIEQEADLCVGDLLAWAKTRIRGPVLQRQGLVDEPAVYEPDRETAAPEIIIPVALLVLYMGSILSGFIFRGSLTFLPSLLQREINFIASHDEPVVMAAYFTTAVLSLGLVGSWLGGYLNDKVKIPELLPVAIFMVVAPALYGLSRLTDNWLLAAGCVFSFFYYGWQPSQNFLIARYTRKASHGMGFGVNFFLIFGMGSIATAVGGFVVDDYGVDRFYWLMAVIAIATMLIAALVLLVRRYQIRFRWRLVEETDGE